MKWEYNIVEMKKQNKTQKKKKNYNKNINLLSHKCWNDIEMNMKWKFQCQDDKWNINEM